MHSAILAIMLSMCDIDCLRAINVAVKSAQEDVTKALRKRAICCLTHATDLSRWDFGFPRLYKHIVTGRYAKRLKGVPNGEWRLVPVLATQCRVCEDMHHLERTGLDWLQPGYIQREGLFRRSILDQFGITHPGTLMLPRMIDALADGPMRPVQP